jgi:hypothetical protein
MSDTETSPAPEPEAPDEPDGDDSELGPPAEEEEQPSEE